MSDQIPDLEISDTVRIMQTPATEASGLANMRGRVIEHLGKNIYIIKCDDYVNREIDACVLMRV